MQSWARRSDEAGIVALASGAAAAFSGAKQGNRRYVLALVTVPRRRDRELIEWAATALAAADGRQASVEAGRGDDKRSANESRVVALVKLECFDRVRRGAGQLVAERVVADVERKLRAGLRHNDAVMRLGDDTFGISGLITDDDGLDQFEVRIARALASVRLPARLEPLAPIVLAGTPDDVDAPPELAAVDAKLLPVAHVSEHAR